MGKASPTALRKELNTTSLENREKMAIEKKMAGTQAGAGI